MVGTASTIERARDSNPRPLCLTRRERSAHSNPLLAGTFPDGLSDMGRMLQLFADAVRHSRNATWMAVHLPGALRIGRWLLRARAAAVGAYPPADPRHGMPIDAWPLEYP